MLLQLSSMKNLDPNFEGRVNQSLAKFKRRESMTGKKLIGRTQKGEMKIGEDISHSNSKFSSGKNMLAIKRNSYRKKRKRSKSKDKRSISGERSLCNSSRLAETTKSW